MTVNDIYELNPEMVEKTNEVSNQYFKSIEYAEMINSALYIAEFLSIIILIIMTAILICNRIKKRKAKRLFIILWIIALIIAISTIAIGRIPV